MTTDLYLIRILLLLMSMYPAILVKHAISFLLTELTGMVVNFLLIFNVDSTSFNTVFLCYRVACDLISEFYLELFVAFDIKLL